MNKEIVIYSTPTCHFCHMAKEFFNANNIKYTDYNVGEDSAKRDEMISLTKQMGVPVIKIDDTFVIGFNEEKIRAILGMDVAGSEMQMAA